MSDIELGTDWDLLVADGELTLTTGIGAIEQHLRQRLKTFYTEWFLDTRIGISSRENILIKNPDPVIIDTIYKQVVLGTPGVVELLDWKLEVDSEIRQLRLTFRAQTDTNEILEYSEVVGS